MMTINALERNLLFDDACAVRFSELFVSDEIGR